VAQAPISDSSEQQPYETLRGRMSARVRRLTHAVSILTRFGFSWVLHELDLPFPRLRHRPIDEAVARLEMPERLRQALEELGPTAIKLGQVLSSRGDLVSPPYVQELRKLQDDVPASSIEDVRQVVLEELGAPVEEVFGEFSPTPAASASIGQVHKALLKDGTPVAVKIQHKGVAQAVEMDLDILLWAARQAERSIQWAADNHILEVAQEFAYSVRQELNFQIEAQNTQRFHDNMANDDGAYVPKIYWDLTKRRVEVVEWVEGAKADDSESLERYGVDRPAAANTFAALMFRQILRDGYFHGDPHAGNILFPGGNRVVFLDCGNAVAVDRHTRDSIISLLTAALNDDPQEVTDYLLELGAVGDRTDMQQLTSDIGRMISRYSGFRSSAQIGLGELLDQLLAVVLRHGVRVQPSLAAIAKSLMVVEGLCLTLDAKFDSQGVVREEAQHLMLARLSPARMAGDFIRLVKGMQRNAQQMPRGINQVLQKLQGGGVRLRLVHENIDRPLHRLDLMVNRIAFAIVVAAIIASSTTLVTSEKLGSSLGFWVTSVYLIVGIVLGGWLLFSILRSGRL
jgi:ubiquinone biosynthesis protein